MQLQGELSGDPQRLIDALRSLLDNGSPRFT